MRRVQRRLFYKSTLSIVPLLSKCIRAMTREFLPGDHTRCLDCAKLNHGKSAVDVCQECSGLSTQCVGCDGNPDPNDARRAKFDACELCGGNNSTCRCVYVFLQHVEVFCLKWILTFLLSCCETLKLDARLCAFDLSDSSSSITPLPPPYSSFCPLLLTPQSDALGFQRSSEDQWGRIPRGSLCSCRGRCHEPETAVRRWSMCVRVSGCV